VKVFKAYTVLNLGRAGTEEFLPNAELNTLTGKAARLNFKSISLHNPEITGKVPAVKDIYAKPWTASLLSPEMPPVFLPHQHCTFLSVLMFDVSDLCDLYCSPPHKALIFALSGEPSSRVGKSTINSTYCGFLNRAIRDPTKSINS